MQRAVGIVVALCALITGTGGTVRAEPLRVDASAERMRVDGALREWKGARFAQLGSGDDAAVRFALATADAGVYLGAEISDDKLVRAKAAGSRQDALVLTFAMPDEKSQWRVTEVWLHAGETGKSKALAGLGQPGRAARSEARIKVVEGPRENGAGYVLEAFIPWSLVDGATIWEQGRASLRFEDVDSAAKPEVDSTLASASAARASDLPRLALGVGHKDFLGSFLSDQNLVGIEPRFDLRGNVHGDGAPERVVLVDRFVLVYGPGYKKGETFGYFALPLGMGGGLKSAELVELTGDGRAELAIVLRQRNDLGAREVWMVVSLAEDSPRPIFGIELRKEATGGFIESSLSMNKKGSGVPRIRVVTGRSQGLDASTYQEGRASDMQAILLPWGEVRARTYAFDGASFAVVDEEKSPASATAATASASPASGKAPPTEPVREQPITPTIEAVLTLFKKDQKLAAKTKPTRHQHANFVGSRDEEHLFVFGTTLVLLGPDIDGGASYLAYGLPISDPADVLYVGSADVTSDGAREIFVRIKQPLSGAEGVHREVALVLRLDAEGRLGRALAAEVTRRQGPNVIANRVLTRGGVLVIDPGLAEGWAENNYPFTSDSTGGVERLLVPWVDRALRYRLEAGRLVATP